MRWEVRLGEGWLLEERVCWDGGAVRLVMPELRGAIGYVTSIVDEQGRALPLTSRGAEVRGGRCAVLTMDLGRLARELDDDDALRILDNVLFGSPDAWLWRPEPWPPGTSGRLALTLPDDMQASVPWPRAGDGAYLVDATTWRMMCRAAFGRLSLRTVDVGGASLTLARLPGSLTATDAGLTRWLETAAGSVSLATGRFPAAHAQIFVLPVGMGRAIPFGMAMRGGGPTALMLVSSTARDEDLLGEWVGVHELAHLLLPPLRREDAWLGEGLASYYQEILRGRAGVHEPSRAWAELVDGFERGRDAVQSSTLRDASARMDRERAYFQVYWGGAAILLRLDVEARRQGRSLDQLVRAVRAREPRDGQQRAAAEVIRWMGAEAAELPVQAIVDAGLSQPFPEVGDLLDALGVKRLAEGRVELRDDAPDAALRDAILAPVPAAPSRSAGTP